MRTVSKNRAFARNPRKRDTKKKSARKSARWKIRADDQPRDLPYPRKIWGLPTFFASTTANRWTAQALPDDPADDLARRFRERIPARAIDEIKRQRYRPSLSFSIIDLHHRHAAALSLKSHIARVTACPGFSQSRRHPSRRNHRHHPQHLQVQCRENQTGSQ